MDLQDRRIRLAELMFSIDEDKYLVVFEKLMASLGLQRREPLLSREEVMARLDEAMEDAKAGRTTDAADLLKEIDGW